MRIDGVKPVEQNTSAKRAASAGATFSVGEAGQPTRAANTAATGATLGIDGLMALQAEDGPLERRRRAVKKGKDALDALDALKLAIIEGHGGAGAAQKLAAVSQGSELTGDAGLDATLQEISVRAAVELAKLKRNLS